MNIAQYSLVMDLDSNGKVTAFTARRHVDNVDTSLVSYETMDGGEHRLVIDIEDENVSLFSDCTYYYDEDGYAVETAGSQYLHGECSSRKEGEYLPRYIDDFKRGHTELWCGIIKHHGIFVAFISEDEIIVVINKRIKYVYKDGRGTLMVNGVDTHII